MYRTIVIALDGSEGSDRALPVAAEYARRDGARMVVAHVRTHALETAIENKLRGQVAELQADGIDSSLIIKNGLDGAEADVIAAVAADAEADLIVVAGRGRGPFTGAVLGSVTQRLLPIASCPVLVVPGSHVADAAGSNTATAARA